MTFTFETIKNGGKESQYGIEQFSDEFNTVDAIYINPANPTMSGNILAAALPPQPSDDTVIGYSSRGLPWFDYRVQVQKDIRSQFLDINSIKEIRFAMPYQFDLASSIHSALLQAATNRYIVYDQNQIVSHHISGTEQVAHCKSFSSNGGTQGNFILAGTAGTGKSTALITALHYYPQIIIHHCKEIPMFTQVLYIIAEVPPNSNLGGLYKSIAKAYDKALKNLDRFYERGCESRITLDQKEGFISDLIERYHTLLIVVDEIQNIDFSRNKANSIFTLLKLKNETKISMAFCGLYSACEKLLADYAMQRRVKTVIDSNPYTQNRPYFSAMVYQLFKYQWFYPKVDLEKMDSSSKTELVETLYQYTGGIVDQLISLYTMMNYEYVRRKKKPVVNADFVKTVSNKFYPNILTTLNGIHNSYEKQLERSKVVKSASETLSKSIQKLSKDENEKKIEKLITNKSSFDADALCKDVIRKIQEMYPEYSYDTITSVFYTLIAKNDNQSKTAGEISRIIVDKLSKSKKSKTECVEVGIDKYLGNDYQPLAREVS